ncbi:MAG: hypothetical protein QME51_03760, partial [Planctomycetota bacterium]|nr:hypothetical protein [Planctomycetota bacterium]
MKKWRVDIEREKRCGFPEVIFCQNKEPADTARIAREILRHHKYLLATRADKKTFQAVKRLVQDAVYHKRARIITVDRRDPKISFLSPAQQGEARPPSLALARRGGRRGR